MSRVMRTRVTAANVWLTSAVRFVAAVAAGALLAAACTGENQDAPAAGTSGGDSATDELVISSFGGSWGEAIEIALVQPFEAETGINVELLPSQDNARERAAIEAGNQPTVDIADGGFRTIAGLAEADLLEPIDYSVFDDAVLEAVPEQLVTDYGVGWGQFGIGICYDNETFPDGSPQPTTWEDFWNVEEFPGNRAMQTWAVDPAPEFALLADGVPVEELYPPDLDRAFAKLAELRDAIPTFTDSPAVLQQLLVEGEAVMIACFTHRMQTLKDSGFERANTSFDHAKLQTETFMVWKNAPNVENAMQFIAFALRPENQARWAQIANAGPVNRDAFESIPSEIAETLPTSPSHETTFIQDDSYYNEMRDDGTSNFEYITQQLWPEFVSQ